jgi:hypothetical protein
MRRPDLVPDCGSCAAVCCIATAFDASDDFAFDKAASARCRHLQHDFRCRIHDDLLARGCPGCAAYDCYGAGQRVTRAFKDAEDDLERNRAFLILREAHELLWLLTEAAKLCPPSDGELGAELARMVVVLDAIASGLGPGRADVDLCLQRVAAHALLRRVGDALGGRRPGRVLVVVE